MQQAVSLTIRILSAPIHREFIYLCGTVSILTSGYRKISRSSGTHYYSTQIVRKRKKTKAFFFTISSFSSFFWPDQERKEKQNAQNISFLAWSGKREDMWMRMWMKNAITAATAPHSHSSHFSNKGKNVESCATYFTVSIHSSIIITITLILRRKEREKKMQ